MREIKFRAWAKAENKMYYAEKSGRFSIDFYGNVIFNRDTWAYDLVLMQFTGLKDKNEKEIYEGDIVKNIKDDVISDIKWEHGRWKYWVEDCLECFNESVKLEVIGNIYENTELLNIK